MRVFLNSKFQDLTVINCPSLIKSSLESASGCMILIDWHAKELCYFLERKNFFSFFFLEIYTFKYSGKIMLLIYCLHNGFPPTVMLNDSYQNDWSSESKKDMQRILQLPKYKRNHNFLRFCWGVLYCINITLIFIILKLLF